MRRKKKKRKKERKRLKAKQLWAGWERIILSFGCSFRLFIILSEPVVPPLITRAFKHAWVWSLEILKWAKIFSFVMYLRRVSVDHFKLYIQWHITVLLASPLASVPSFAVALVQKGSRHSFFMNLSPSQHHQRPYLPATPIEHFASGVVPRKDKRDHSSSYCISIRKMGVRFFLIRFPQIVLLVIFSISFSLGGFFSSQVKILVHKASSAARHFAFTHQRLLSCFLEPVVKQSACKTTVIVHMCMKPTLVNLIAS